jgi:HlyD family secretion protein
MQTVSESTSTTALPAAYARRKVAAAHASRRWWYAAAAVVFLGAVALILRSAAPGWVGRLLGREANAVAFHVVEPATLAITLTEDGELKPRESIELKCEVEGQSTILSVVDESTRVKKGDLLLELASDTLVDRLESEQMELRRIQANLEDAIAKLEIQRSQNTSDLKKAEIDLEVAELDLKKYLEGDFPQKLNSVNLDIEQAQMDKRRREEELRKKRYLKEKGFVTAMKIEELEFALRKAQITLERHELSKKILLEYERPKIEMQKQSAVDRAREELGRVQKQADSKEQQAQARKKEYEDQLQSRQRRVERVQKQLEKCKIYAPADGMVQYPQDNWRWGSERIAAGQRVHEGQTMLVLPDTSQMIVNTRIHEADRHLLQEGLPCVVTVPAVPGETFTGKITKIDKFADSENRWLNPDLKEHSTEILLDATDAPVSPGDTAEVKILIDTLEDVLAVPVQCVFTRGSRSFVFVQNGGAGEPVGVTLGRSNTNMVEIVDGLEQGDRVLMHADEQLLAQLPSVQTSEAVEQLAPPPVRRAATPSAQAEAARKKPAVKATKRQPEAADSAGAAAEKSGT